jgi:hypothetical protein
MFVYINFFYFGVEVFLTSPFVCCRCARLVRSAYIDKIIHSNKIFFLDVR